MSCLRHIPRNRLLLCRNLCTSSSSSSSSSPSCKRSSIESVVDELLKLRNLKTLAQKFKESSESDRFRSKHRIYEMTVSRLASAKKFDLIGDILEDQKRYPDMAHEGFAVRLITLYGKAGMLEHARKLFDEMPNLKCPRSAKSCNALLAAYVNSKNYDIARTFFKEMMPDLSVKPDLYTYNIMIRYFRDIGDVDSALSLLDDMRKDNIQPNVITFNTLLNGFYGAGRFTDAEKIWAKMEENRCIADIVCFNAKLRGLVAQKRIQDAEEVVDNLWKRGLKPDIHSFNALIKGYCDEENVDKALKIFRQAIENECSPIRTTLETLIPLACKKGDYNLAFRFCKEGLNNRCFIKVEVLMSVVEGLVKESRVEDAKELINLGLSKVYSPSTLKLPEGAE